MLTLAERVVRCPEWQLEPGQLDLNGDSELQPEYDTDYGCWVVRVCRPCAREEDGILVGPLVAEFEGETGIAALVEALENVHDVRGR